MPLPVRAAFAYKKKKDRREYVRVALRRAADGEIEAVKHPQDGAGVLTSLTETDGLLEFPEDVTAIEPGDSRRLLFLRRAHRLTADSLCAETHTRSGAEGNCHRIRNAVETTPPITATTMAATQAMMKLFMELAPLPDL